MPCFDYAIACIDYGIWYLRCMAHMPFHALYRSIVCRASYTPSQACMFLRLCDGMHGLCHVMPPSCHSSIVEAVGAYKPPHASCSLVYPMPGVCVPRPSNTFSHSLVSFDILLPWRFLFRIFFLALLICCLEFVYLYISYLVFVIFYVVFMKFPVSYLALFPYPFAPPRAP